MDTQCVLVHCRRHISFMLVPFQGTRISLDPQKQATADQKPKKVITCFVKKSEAILVASLDCFSRSDVFLATVPKRDAESDSERPAQSKQENKPIVATISDKQAQLLFKNA